MKLSCKLVRDHRVTCNEIINNPETSVTAKATAFKFLKEMEGKDDDEYHTLWYVGETVRKLRQRMKERYPWILMKFGVTHMFQIAQAPAANENCTAKWLTLLLESIVAGSFQATNN